MIKKLEDYSEEEWEAVCNNCGKCCLVKLQNEEDDEIYYTDVVCQYFNEEKCRCSVYENRCTLVPSCLKLTQANVDKIAWMPKSCAYRCLFENRPHPINKSIKGRCISELMVKEEDLEDHIVEWEDL